MTDKVEIEVKLIWVVIVTAVGYLEAHWLACQLEEKRFLFYIYHIFRTSRNYTTEKLSEQYTSELCTLFF